MPVQSYTINTRDAIAGQLYGMQQSRADIASAFVETGAGIGFGLACKVGTGARGVELGGAAHVAGISVRQIDREAATRPSDGTVVFRKGEALPLLKEGSINVKVADAGTMVSGAVAHVNAATGEFSIAGGTATTNVTWVLNGTVAAGDIVPVRITNADLNA